jgi:NADPH:quinone reductase-like Zn-dependent oxidoreductase
LEDVAGLVSDSTIKIAIERRYPFDIASIRRAYTKLSNVHVHGKLVIEVD